MTIHKILVRCLLLGSLGITGAAISQIPGLPGSGSTCDPAIQSCAPGTTPPSSPTTPAPTPGTCTPGAGGSPCNSGGPASQSSATGINVGAGNPINIITGNKYQREEDMPALPGVLGLEIVRHYNSTFSEQGMPNGILGRGWKLSYETDLYVVGRTVQIVQADGARIIFSRSESDPSLCASANPANGKVVITKTARGEEFTWIWTNGRKLSFNSLGKLVQIQAPTGEFVSMQHDRAGNLLKVTDPQGRELRLVYLDQQAAGKGDRFRGVQAIDSPVGRFKYEYGSELPKGSAVDKAHVLANLVKVTIPTHYDSKQKMHAYTERGVSSSSVSRIYHYEDARRPTFLTGITVSGSGSDGKLLTQRIATYGYDVNGKANLSVKGEPARLQTGPDGKPLQPARLVEGTGIEQVTLDRSQPGVTILSNSLAQKTTYRHGIVGGEYRLLEVRGPGCATCGETNVRYGYDKLARLVDKTRLSAAGVPMQTVRTEFDRLGRIIKINTIAFSGGKPLPAQWQLRYEYQGDATEPILIARPSVVPGQEFRTRIAYGNTEATRLLPVEVTETGFAPGIDRTETAREITRTVRYRYNAEGQRIEIDGPLANAKDNPGPANSDITVTEYDPKNKLIRKVSAPGNIFTEVRERDAALRPTLIVNSDGVRTVETRLVYSHSGQIQEMARSADFVGRQAQLPPMISRFSYDVNGRLAVVTGPDNIALRTEYDAAGRPVALLDTSGNRVNRRFDTEGKLLAVVAQDAQGQILNGLLNLWDEHGELRARLTPAGLDMAQGPTPIAGQSIRLDGTGQVSASALNGNHTYTLAADNTPRHLLVGRSGMALVDAAGRVNAIIKDDFGRIVLESSPDEGKLAYRHDGMSFEKRHSGKDGKDAAFERLEFSSVGRLIKRTRAGCTETLQYEGDLLAGISGCGNRHEFERDAFGQIVRHTQIFDRDEDKAGVIKVSAPARPLTFSTTYKYDPASGRLMERRLPDGQRVAYNYHSADGKMAGIARDAGWVAWIDRRVGEGIAGGLRSILPRSMTEQTLLDDIAWRPFGGMAAATSGNGIRVQSAFDQAGRLVTQNFGTASQPESIEKIRYRYDGAGNIMASSRNAQETRYQYDAMYRLTGERAGPFSDNAVAIPVALSAAPQAQPAVAGGAVAANDLLYAYDPLGRRSGPAAQVERDGYGRQGERDHQRFTYDDAHRLVMVSNGAKTLARYRYDALGNRVSKTINGRTTYYIYDTAHKLVAEADESGTITRQYLHAGFLPYAVMQGEGGGQTRDLYAVHADHRGLPLAVTDEDRRVVWRGDFDAFGNARAFAKQKVSADARGGFELNLRMAGQYEDKETGLYYNVHRYYDPRQGQYITPDPLGLAGGADSYAYVGGNPMRAVDPVGLFKIPAMFFGATFGGIGKDPLNDFWSVDASDSGHADILRIAFSQYQHGAGQMRFSPHMLDWIIRNNYHTDAHPNNSTGAGQYNPNNHFDNPNEGPMYEEEVNLDSMDLFSHRKESYKDGNNDFWLADSVSQVGNNRLRYGETSGKNISGILAAFGQNSHALADFYAHSNWVDSAAFTTTTVNGVQRKEHARGGWVENSELLQGTECGWIPPGLGMSRVWNGGTDDINYAYIFTGSAHSAHETLFDKENESSHAYWNKDTPGSAAGSQAYTRAEQVDFAGRGMYYWQVAKYDPARPPAAGTWYADYGKTTVAKGDRIYVRSAITSRHHMAWHLAIEHTKQEIDRLYNAAAGVSLGAGLTLQDVFKMDKATMDANNIIYNGRIAKD